MGAVGLRPMPMFYPSRQRMPAGDLGLAAKCAAKMGHLMGEGFGEKGVKGIGEIEGIGVLRRRLAQKRANLRSG